MNRAVKLLDFSKQQDVCQSISEFQYWVPGQDGESLNEKQKPYYKILTKGFAALAQNPKMDCSPYVSKEYLQGVISQVEKLNLYPKDYFVLISGRLTTAPMALANCRIDKIYRDHVVVELHADEKLRPGQIRLWSAVSAGDCTLTVQNEKLKRGYRTRFFYRDAQQNVLLQMEENFQDIAQIEAGILQGKNPPGAKPRPPVRTLSLSN